MPTWPITLPTAPLMDRFRETPPDNVLRTEMETGPAKLRRRTTAGVRVLALTYLLSAEQVADLDAFYKTTLYGGALAFSFTHPREGGTVSCRFREPPVYTPVNGNYYRATLNLEVLP